MHSRHQPDANVAESGIRLLELIATEAPEFLPLFVELLRQSALRFVAENIARGWGIRLDELSVTVATASAELDSILSSRGKWQAQALAAPNLPALTALAEARSGRRSSKQRLGQLVRRLQLLLAEKRQEAKIKSRLHHFLNEPPMSSGHRESSA